MAEVRYEQATRIYPGTDVPAVAGLDLRIGDGELIVLVGPSGSGKTTALRMLAGLEEVDGGAIFIGERDVTDDPPKARDVAMVFQNYALYPYLTVAANIGFPLKVAGVKKPERERRVGEAAELLGLTEYLGRKPGQLSGGQRPRGARAPKPGHRSGGQRQGVARGGAIVREASVFLMDEPLSNLDAKLRVQMRADIAELQARLNVTTVYVTHDQAEAMTLGHRVAVLHDGELQQCAPPRELYDFPANTFVAGFIGSPAMSFLTVPQGSNGSVSIGGVELALPGPASGSDVVVGVRPEALELAADGIGAEVQVVEDVGADAYVFCTSDAGKLVARSSARRPPARGERVALRPVAAEAHLFDAASGARLG